MEAVLQPGEVLFIPQYWWHHIENVSDGCISLNFWFKDTKKPERVILPLSATQHLAMRRNVEKLVVSKVGAKEAQRILPLLAASLPTEALVSELRTEIVTLLANVLPPQRIDEWLRELTDHRFDLGVPDGTQGGATEQAAQLI